MTVPTGSKRMSGYRGRSPGLRPRPTHQPHLERCRRAVSALELTDLESLDFGGWKRPTSAVELPDR